MIKENKTKRSSRNIEFERERKELKRKLRILSWETFFLYIPQGIFGISFLTISIPDLIEIIKERFFQPDRYTKLSARYSQITGETIDRYTVDTIVITLFGIGLTLSFIYYLKVELSYFFSEFKTNKKKNNV